MDMKTTLLNKKEKAMELGITTRTLDRQILADKVHYIKVGKSKRKWFLPEGVNESIEMLPNN